MAVVPMKKVRVVVHESDIDAVLDMVQRAEALEFQTVEPTESIKPTELVFPHHQLLPRAQHAVHFLEQYAPKVGLWRTLREGTQTTITETQVADKLRDTDAIELVVSDLERLQVEFAEVTEKYRMLKEQHKTLTAWRALPVPIAHLSSTRTTTLLVAAEAVNPEMALKEKLTNILTEQSIPHHLIEVSDTKVAVTVPKEASWLATLDRALVSIGAVVVETPHGTETPEIELVAVEEQLAAVKGDLAVLHDQAEHFAITHYESLRVAAEVLSWQRDRFVVIENALATKHTIVLEGWMNADKRPALEAELTKQKLAAVLTELEPAANEEPPVEIKNSPLVQPFEAVTRLYGMPGYKDLDPTVFLAGFFFLFFGMSLTDVGYGLFLMVAATVILTLFKVAAPVRMFAKLLLLAGFAAVLVGLLFGGYLGIPSEHIPEVLKRLQLYDPIANPLPVFYTALGLGVIQVMFGMLLKIHSEARNGRLLSGVLDQGPWLFVFVLGILYLGVSTGYVTFLTTAQIINLIYVGVVMIVLASGRKGNTLLMKVRNAALSLYDSIGYFSDILSYSRLLALGLATTALAFAVNLIAGMVSSIPYIGVVLALVVLAIGHLFTLAVNTLGAFIHSARLQFVEFFGKFIAGTGRSFAPLSRTHKHVTVREP